MAKVPFLSFFLGPDMNTEWVWSYMYLKHFPDYIDFNMSSWFKSLGSSILADIPFLVFLSIHRVRKRCGQVRPSQYYS